MTAVNPAYGLVGELSVIELPDPGSITGGGCFTSHPAWALFGTTIFILVRT